ncbi:hypothetical protein [Aestuariivirga sp.]|uniref:hypothetical protein n=1 Tax=Aestuariivirga sp. TaxID=2650926 RepID=UPI0039E635E9
MQLSKRDIAKLKKIVDLAQSVLASASVPSSRPSTTSSSKRIRRTGQELLAFRKMLKAERKKGTPALELARKHGVSSAYIYTL